MKFINQIKIFKYKLRNKRRYKRLKKCSIPYPFDDKKRDVFEWVTFNKNIEEYDVQSNLTDAMGDIIGSNLVYHYRAKLFGREEPEPHYRLVVSHCHNFDRIVRKLYDYPETFEIPDEYLNEYSEQELSYLKQIKNYLLLIGLKDYRKSKEKESLDEKWNEIDKKKHKSIKDKLFMLRYKKNWEKIDEREKFKRCENSKALELSSYYPLWVKDKVANALVSGKKNYLIYVQHSFSSSRLNEKYLVINNNCDYVGIVKVISEDVMKFKELQENMVDYRLAGFENFKKYKDNLLEEFQEESKIRNEAFTEDSLIKYVKLEVMQKY